MSKSKSHVNHFEDFDEKFFDEPELLDEFNENYDPVKTTSTYHIQQAEQALKRLKSVVEEPDWKKVLEIKAGIAVYSKDEIDQAPIYMSKHIIEDFSPQSIFAVIGMRKLWDPWYEEGNLVENLDDTTSLTYMVMQVLAGTRSRDLSLVEKIEYTSNGTIYFAATSVETPKVPRTDKIRAHLHLNGWIVTPISKSPPRTRITYVLQSEVGGWVPAAVARKYLTKRPLVIYSIDQYLHKNGPPIIPDMAVGSTTTSSRPSRSTSVSSVPSYTGHSVEPLRSNGYKTEPNNKLLYSQNIQNIVPVQSLPEVPIHNGAIENSFKPDDDEIEIDSSQDTFEDQKRPTSPRQPTKLSTRSITPIQHHFPPVPNSTLNKSRFPPVRPIIPIKDQSEPSVHSASPVMSTQSSSSIKSHMKNNLVSSKGPKSPTKHRFTEAIDKAAVTFRKNVTNMKGWYFYMESKGVKVYMKDVKGRSTPIIRGEYTLDGGFTTEDVLSVIRNMSLRRLWDDRFDDGDIIENFGNDAELVRLATKGTFPVSGRDFAYFAIVERDPETGSVLNVSVSVDDPAIPEVKKYVRANLSFAGWQMVPEFDFNGNTKSLKIVYIVDMDIKLDNIPSAILKSISTGTPMVVQKVDEFLQKVGFPPYVLKTSSLILSSNLDPKTFQYDLSLDIKEGNSVTEVRFSRTMYPNGFDMTVIPEGTKVELLPNNSDTIRMTLPSRVDSSKLKIKIVKHTTKGVKMTYNGSNKIPLAPKGDTITRKKSSTLERGMAEPGTKTRTKNVETIKNKNIAEYSPQLQEPITLTHPTSTNNFTNSASSTPVGTVNYNALNNYTTNTNTKSNEKQVTDEKQERRVVNRKQVMYERHVVDEDERQLVEANERQVMDENQVVDEADERQLVWADERQVMDEKQVEYEADEKQLVWADERQVMDEKQVVYEADERQLVWANERQVMDEKQVEVDERQLEVDERQLEVDERQLEVNERHLVVANERQVMDKKQMIVEESIPLINKIEEKNVKVEKSVERNSISVRMSYIRDIQNRYNDDIIILSDRMRFNSQQAGLMFAAMLLSYYAGKYSLY